MFTYFWENPLISVNQKTEKFDPISLGDNALSSSDTCDSCVGVYDNALLSGSKFTGDTLMSQEKELLAKFKLEYQSHDHTHNCETEEVKEEDEWSGEACEYICGCCEFDEDTVAKDKNGDVIDRFHCVHFHKNEQERFRHLKKAKNIIKNCKSWRTIVRQLKKVKKLRNLLV